MVQTPQQQGVACAPKRLLRHIAQLRGWLPVWAVPAASALLAVYVVVVTFHARIVLHAAVDSGTRASARDSLVTSGLSLIVFGVPLLLAADRRSPLGRAARVAVVVAAIWWFYIRWSYYGWKPLSYW